MAKRRSSPAFSLVEIVIVVVVIGIIAAIAIPKFGSATDEARAAVLMRHLKEIGDAANRYHAMEGEWPVSANGGSAIAASFSGQIKAGGVPLQTPYGGEYRWVHSGAYAYVYVLLNPAPQGFLDAMVEIDETMDDGEPMQGQVLRISGGSYGYLIYLANRSL